jgi:hypothetical protein
MAIVVGTFRGLASITPLDFGAACPANNVAQREDLSIRDLLESVPDGIRYVDCERLKFGMRTIRRHCATLPTPMGRNRIDWLRSGCASDRANLVAGPGSVGMARSAARPTTSGLRARDLQD